MPPPLPPSLLPPLPHLCCLSTPCENSPSRTASTNRQGRHSTAEHGSPFPPALQIRALPLPRSTPPSLPASALPSLSLFLSLPPSLSPLCFSLSVSPTGLGIGSKATDAFLLYLPVPAGLGKRGTEGVGVTSSLFSGSDLTTTSLPPLFLRYCNTGSFEEE